MPLPAHSSAFEKARRTAVAEGRGGVRNALNAADLHTPSYPPGAEPDLSILSVHEPPSHLPPALAVIDCCEEEQWPVTSTAVADAGSSTSGGAVFEAISRVPAEAATSEMVEVVGVLERMCAARAADCAAIAVDGTGPPPPADALGAAGTADRIQTDVANAESDAIAVGASSGAPSASCVDRSLACSEDMLVALGAQVALGEFVAGRTTIRLRAACDRLGTWLEEATSPRCGSTLLFRLQSWHATHRVEPESELASFLCGRAIANRSHFHAQLQRLANAPDGLAYTSMLYELVANLHRPCLRMRMLREVLGLDERFSRDITFGVVCLAFDIVETMARGAPQPPAAHGLDLDGFDEGTRLEADTLFASLAPPAHAAAIRPSDPVGAERRSHRVLCDSRHT